jgi:hypothetical protein
MFAPDPKALPTRLTAAPSSTVWLAPALAVSVRAVPFTVTLTTVSAVAPALSLTARRKVSIVSAAGAGAVKAVVAAEGVVNATTGPAVWVH